MRAFTLLAGCIIFLFAFMAAAYAGDGRYVKIRKPFATIYEYLDPKSQIVEQAKRGDYFELIYEGTSWYQVKVNDKVGWLERRSGNVVENPGLTIMSMPIGTFLLFLFLLLGTFGATSLFVYRQKTAEL